MPFIKNILPYGSVSIVGMAKNTGKTTCLNYVIGRLHAAQSPLAITSIGVDGEERDVLYQTPKPRITLHKGMVFVTAEEDCARREFPADVLAISERTTPLGRLVTARAQGTGQVVLSGPSDSRWLHAVIGDLHHRGIPLVLVDGALSRMSLASPAVTDAMILCTGAACAMQLNELIRLTQFRCRLIDLPQIASPLINPLQALDTGVWRVDIPSGAVELLADSVFTLAAAPEKMAAQPHALYVAGAVTSRFLQLLSAKRNSAPVLIVRDFTRLFIDPSTYDKFERRGGRIHVLQKAALLAVCTNPTSPQGACFDPVRLQNEMQHALRLPVYDIMRIEKEG